MKLKLINDIKHCINYILEGFGFTGLKDFTKSSFGFIISFKVFISSSTIAGIITVIGQYSHNMFGVSLSFLIAYVVLIIFEWLSGIIAAAKRGELHNSRKLGRMLFKISVYSVPLYIFNMFQKEVHFPHISGYELDPFVWAYWTVIVVVIWQLFVSVLENLEELNFKFATLLLKIINKKFYKNFDLEK